MPDKYANAQGQVYPRVCGGTERAYQWSDRTYGLSPRVRGNRQVAQPFPTSGGSIPACAGEPARAALFALLVKVYPRVCGGTGICDGAGISGGGLSPRVRGNHSLKFAIREFRGSIPACAGEPLCGLCRPAPGAVYPRVCGGTPRPLWQGRSVRGLSPRVRGNRSMSPRGMYRMRSIPACAGEP